MVSVEKGLSLLLGIFLILIPSAAWADPNADEIAKRVYDRDDGKDSSSKSNMVLIESGGNERPRSMEVFVKDYGNLSKRLIRFTSPSSIDGTSFLAWENSDRDDDQFLFLPAVGRVRRIVANQKDKSFANTDFTYEDLGRRKVEKDIHRYLKSEKFLSRDCWVIEYVPKKDDDSQYGRTVSWIDSSSYLVLKAEFYNKDNKLKKTFEAKKVETVDGILSVMESLMNNLEDNHRTSTKVTSLSYNKGISDNLFSERYLEHND